MQAYLDLLTHILDNGHDRTDRTGVGTRAVFGYQFRHDLANGFPLLTTKKVHLKSIIHELIWFLRGGTNVAYLRENGVTIWDEWADPVTGELGPVYGHQWRNWPNPDGGTVDQIANLVAGLRKSPDSRRHIVTAWNPADVPKMALPPCHTLWQCQVDQGRLHLQLYARSIDAGLGLPFNLASYALLLMMLAQVSDLKPGEFIFTFGDLHIYNNHFHALGEQIVRAPRPLPTMRLNPAIRDIDGFAYGDFTLEGYDPHPAIKMPIAV